MSSAVATWHPSAMAYPRNPGPKTTPRCTVIPPVEVVGSVAHSNTSTLSTVPTYPVKSGFFSGKYFAALFQVELFLSWRVWRVESTAM